MHVISIKPLRECWDKHPIVEAQLRAWFHDVKNASWDSPQDIKDTYGNKVDFVPGNRVVFDIKGNEFRIIVYINYTTKRVFIRFVGTHSEYDKVDAETI